VADTYAVGLFVPDLAPDTDTISAALAYANAGWYVLPVQLASKHAGSVVGKNWPAKSNRDPHQIVAWFAGTDHGIALHCGRSGAVVFDVDRPDLMPAELDDEIRRTKPPMQSTRDNDDRRGHYVFAQPEGRSIGNGGGKLGGTWGEVRGRNGIIVVEPTPHAKAAEGGRYRWMQMGPVPVLGPAVASMLPDQTSVEDAATDAETTAFLARHTQSLRPELIAGVERRLREDIDNSAGRHPSALKAMCWAMREAQAGMYDACSALARLWPIFRDALRDEPGRQPEAEWRGIVAWAIGQAALDDAAATRARLTSEEPFSSAQPSGSDEPTTEPVAPRVRRGDFAAIGNRERARPAFMKRADGVCLLYPGKDSYLYAETESGKSWLAALTVRQCLDGGVPVLVIDFEEGDEIEYGSRLLALGATEVQLTDASKFRYLMVDERDTDVLLAEAEDMTARVVIIEGMSVAYDLYGLQVKENDSATAFRRQLVKPHLVAGRAVLTTDHVVKDQAARGRYAIGGVMKLNAASGGAFLLVNVQGLAPGQRGTSNLFVTKDRPGAVKRYGVPAGPKFDPQVRRVGTLIVDDSREVVNYLDVRIAAPNPDEPGEPTTVEAESLADCILAAIDRIKAKNREPNLRALRGEKLAGVVALQDEIEAMLTGGQLTESSGKRGARVFDRVGRSTNEA
jgi:hypothetical protein